MNHRYINSLLSLVLPLTMMATLWGCAKEELTDRVVPGQCELSLTITDGGYAPGNTHDSQTRIADDGYRTTFTKTDRIGLYAVDKNGSLVIRNALLQLQDENGELKWKLIGDGMLTADNAERFFVYYPYDHSIPTVNPSVDTADEFFADKISKWSPSPFQEENLYIQNDLMVGMGTPGTPKNGIRPLTVQLAHKMALIVISPPKTRYELSSDNTYTWLADETNLTPDGGGAFHYMEDGTYRYLVKPNVETRLSGTFVNSDDETRKFELTANIPVGSCKTFTIDQAKTTVKTYTIQTGDYYMKNGSLVSKDKPLNDGQKKDCIGIVVKAGKSEDTPYLDNCHYTFKETQDPMPTIHGYILGLENTSSTYTWGSQEVADKNITTDTDPHTFSGYTNTWEIISYVKNNNLTLLLYAKATYYATEYYEKISKVAPEKTSGWFLPSAGQYQWWAEHSKELLPSIKNADGDSWDDKDYWSSTEGDVATTAQYYNISTNKLDSDDKTKAHYVRPWLVF